MSVSPGGAGSSSPGDIDFLDLCTSNVRSIQDLAKGGNLLNRRQCQDLSSKLSKTTDNIREVVLHCGASRTLFRPALTNLYRYLEKGKLLVTNCAEEDWCAAAVFQCQNENAFRVILLEVGLCYNAIYELAKSHSKEWNDHPADLRQSSVFDPATDSNVLEDKEDLQKRLDELASGDTNLEGLAYWVPWWLAYCLAYWIPWRDAWRPSLAKYLLDKMHCTSSQSQAHVLETYHPILWRKASEPSGTWGSSHFLGSGSGASGVCSTTWLGVPCAKKEFHGQEYEISFMKESGILAHLKHPNIVNFICCGNGVERGDRFITMELMEMSLYDLIEKHKQKDEYFSILVSVDIMMQIARGVCYLHAHGVAHRDLKPQNVVVNQLSTPQLEDHYCVKLVDFGVSKVEVATSKPNTMTACGIGTWMYRAPEVHPKANPKSKVKWLKADVFSFAMTCAHLLSLETPFQDVRPNELFNEVTKNEVRPTIHHMYPKDLVVLLKDCWKINPCLRPSFANICTRLEIFQHKYLRTHLTLDEGMKEDTVDTNEGFDFINKSLDSFTKDRGGDDVEGEISHDIVSTISCTCGSALQFLRQSPYVSKGTMCNICQNLIDEECYHCETCQFDAHPQCAEFKDEVEVFFHYHTLHLLLQNYYKDKPNSVCCFCKESIQESEWVYRCEQCDFDVHLLCTKFPREIKGGYLHDSLLTMRQCLRRKCLQCHWCNGEIKESTWYYTCWQQSCGWAIHSLCSARAWNPPCVFDITHRLDLIPERKSFYCSKCGALGFSWTYSCDNGCNVDIHPDCVDYLDEEKCNWNGAYERFMMESQSKGNCTKMNMLLELFNNMPICDALEASSSSQSRFPSAMPRVEPSTQRLTLMMERPSLDASKDKNLQRQIAAETAERIKANKMAAKEASQKLRANLLEMLESMEKVVLDLQSSENMSQDDAEVLTATLEKLKRRQDLVKEQRAMQVQSKMSQGPRIAVFFQRRKEIGKWVWELLTSVRADMKGVCWALLCEEPGHEHIANGKSRIRRREFGEVKAEKVGPLIASGLQVVRKAMSTLDPLKLVGLKSIIIPSLGIDIPWDLRAIEHEKHDIESNDLSEDEEKVEALKQAQDSAAEWLRSWSEERGMSMLYGHGLQRVRYKVTEEGDYPKYRRGSLAWLCTDHLNSGLKDGTLEQAPLKYYNVEDDLQLRWPHVTFKE